MSRGRAPRAERLLHSVTATDAPPPGAPLLRDVVGGRLRRARTAQGRSLKEVADAAGVSTGHLSQVERGLAEASSEVVRAVCRSLGLPQAVLLRAVAADLALAEPALAPVSAPTSARVASPAPLQALAA